jgi:transposase-like protein
VTTKTTSASEEHRSPAEAAGGDATVVRGRPGRRTAKEKHEAVLKLLSGRASVDQVAREYGVLPETVEGWRTAALAAMEGALLTGDARTERERTLERENRDLREALGRVSVERALALKAVEEWKQQTRPSRPTRSRR